MVWYGLVWMWLPQATRASKLRLVSNQPRVAGMGAKQIWDAVGAAKFIGSYPTHHPHPALYFISFFFLLLPELLPAHMLWYV